MTETPEARPPLSTPAVSVVVLSYNKRDYTRLCIDGLLRTLHRPLEIIIVDQGSSDGTDEMLTAAAADAMAADVNLRVIRNETNRGAPGGRNQGIAPSSGELLLFIDNDAIPFNREWLGRMVEGIQRLPDAGVVSARLLYPFAPHLVQFAGCGISPTGRVKYLGRGAERDESEFAGDREAQCLISACILTRADALRAAGGFDEAFSPVQYEDLDLCYKLREAGWRCYVVGEAEVYHFENVTTDGSTDINFRYVTIKNGMLFKQRWRHRFEHEAGPSDSETGWANLPHKSLADMGAGWAPWATE